MEECLLIEKVDKKHSICRVCLKYDPRQCGQGLSVFEKHNNILIYEKINYIAGIEIKKNDELPQAICSSCLVELESACDFKQKCESSDAILRSALPLSKPFQEHFIEFPIKEENADEYEYDYLDENILSPSELPTVDVQPKGLDIQPRDGTFTSKAINLKLECHDCGGFFKSKCKLRVHWKKEHLPKQLTCPYCKKILKSYKSFHSHMKKRSKGCMNASKLRIEGEGRSRIYHCKLCDAKSKRIQTIMTHLVVHTGERPYPCSMCSKTFTQHSSLIAHKEGAHKVYAKEGTCHQCGKYFKGRRSLYKHMKTHLNSQFPCKVCFKILRSKPILRQHMKRHSGVKGFTCEVCAKTFYTSSDLCNHKNKMHEKRKVYTCDRCEYKTCNSGCMAKHRPRHTDHNVACEVCGKFLDNLQQLMMHRKRHFEKDFQCIFCNKMFYGRKNLSSHVRKIHNMYALGKGRPTTANGVKTEVKSTSE